MQSKVGEIYEGKITGLTSFGAFVKLSNGESGMVHISEVASTFVKEIKDHLTEGQDVRVKVLAVNENNKISLSIKQAEEPKKETENRPRRPSGYAQKDRAPRGFQPKKESQQSSSAMSFEDMMAKFKQESDEKMSVLKKTTDFKGNSRRGNR